MSKSYSQLLEGNVVIKADFEKKTKRLIIRFYNGNDFALWKKTQDEIPKPKNKWDIKLDPKFKGTRAEFSKVLRLESKARKNERFLFIAIDRKSGNVIGQAIIFDIRRAVFQSGGIGYSIYNQHWGQGYGREFVQAVLRIGFEKLTLHRIEACIELKNRRSIRLAQSLGMIKEGLRRGFVLIENEWKSLVVYSILSEDMKIPSKFSSSQNDK